MKRESVGTDLSWLLKRGIVQIVDKLIKSSEFRLRIKQMKVAYMATGVEGGKQVIREQVAIGKFIPGEPSSFRLDHTWQRLLVTCIKTTRVLVNLP